MAEEKEKEKKLNNTPREIKSMLKDRLKKTKETKTEPGSCTDHEKLIIDNQYAIMQSLRELMRLLT